MDDSELLTIFDPAGRQVGVKPRAEVHRDHDWHWLVFVLAARPDPGGQARILLQIRARTGDPYQGSLDAPAGGHVTAMESHRQGALREFHEEVGIRLQDEDLSYLGQRFLENPTGVCRRVIEHFYLCRRSLELREVTCGEEAGGFVEVGLEDFVELLEGERHTIKGCAILAGEGDELREMTITRRFLASYSDAILDSFRRSMRAIRTYLYEGQVDPGIWI